MVVVIDSSVPGRVAHLLPAWRKCLTMTIRTASTICLLVCQRLTPLVSTDAMARIRTLDPEAAQHLLDPILQRMIDAVHHYEGTVNQMLGDGLMALFGAPVAQEDHALRACYAALAMQAAL